MPSDTVVVIGGGPGGLTAARAAAELGAPVVLVEARERLGGTPISANYAALTPDFRPAEEAMAEMVAAVEALPQCTLRTSTRVTARSGEAGDFRLTLSAAGGETETLEAGAVILATGFDHFDPGRETQMYGYYEYEDVLTLQDLEAQLKDHHVTVPSTGRPPEHLCFIQCVGSRDRRIGNTWCSKVCCGIATKESIEVKRLVPSCRVYVFYIDMRMYGFWEDQLYWRAQEEHHVQFIRGIVTEVIRRGDKLVVKGEDTTMGRPVEAPMDMVVLSVGMEPSRGTREMAAVLDLPLESHGFIATVGAPLDTVTTPVPGIFVAGAAAGPKDLEDTVSMAGLAAAKAVALVRRPAAAAQPVAGQVVDTPAVREFLDRAMERITREECRAISRECAGKAALIQGLLAPDRCAGLREDDLHVLLRAVFSTRRRAGAVLDAARAGGGLGPALAGLAWGEEPVDRRVDTFVDRLGTLRDPELACDLAGEVLHHVRPGRFWLLSRWMWSPRLRTGALALVTTEADLAGGSAGETYLKLGRVLVMLRASAEAAGLLGMGDEPWDLDVLLACVYCVYLYTITRLRMTQEFNRVIPPLPELVRRLLGVHRLGVLET